MPVRSGIAAERDDAAGSSCRCSLPRRWLWRVRGRLDRPRLWQATTALFALLLAALIAGATQGSFQVLLRRQAPVVGWSRWCGQRPVRTDRVRLAYCARVQGIVVDETHGPAPDESHLAVLGDFRLTIIRLSDGPRAPGVGTRVAVVGPLLRARDGQREVQAFHWRRL